MKRESQVQPRRIMILKITAAIDDFNPLSLVAMAHQIPIIANASPTPIIARNIVLSYPLRKIIDNTKGAATANIPIIKEIKFLLIFLLYKKTPLLRSF